MKPETILQSDVLDIIFENRNKDYGAYALRKNYNTRLIQALGGTFLLVGLFIVLQSMHFTTKAELPASPLDTLVLATVILPEDKPKDPLPEEKPKPKPKQKTTTLNATVPVITAKPVETPMATQDQMSTANLGTKTEIVEDPGTGDPGPIDISEGGNGVEPTPVEPFDEVTVRDYADVMPAFKGDIVKFMLRHLRQPDDLEEGERIVIRVKFVVTKDGEISDVEVIQSGRRDLDQEVVRVVKKMPRWKPGMQAGRNVPVYFNLPVTFVGNY